MANGKNDNTLLALGAGAIALYLWKKNQDAAAAGTTPVPGSHVAVTPLTPSTNPTQAVAGAVGAAIGNSILPGAGAVVGAIAQTEVNAAQQILAGDVNPVNLATVAFLPVAVTATAVNFISDVFGWSGKPLDQVNDVLLSPFTQGNKDNTGGGPIYAMDTGGVLHPLQKDPTCAGDIVWCANYSWREIIAVRPEVISQFAIGAPISHREQINPVPRPLDPDALRNALGFDIIFKLGNSNTLYGPGIGASTPTLVGVHSGAPEGDGAVYQVVHPWEGGDYNLHPIGRSWKRHIASASVLYGHGWSFSNILWVDQSQAGLIPTYEELTR